MKIKSFLAASVAAVALFASCSNEDDVKGIEPIEGVKTMAKITLTQTASNTRADVAATDPGEVEVNTARLYIFTNTGILEKVVDFSTKTSEAFEITTGNKTFLAAVNIPVATLNTVTTTVGSTTLTSIKGEISEISVTTAVAAEFGKFWMTSLDDETKHTIEEATKEEVEALVSPKNNFNMSVGRVVAKVGIYFKPETPYDGELTSVKYKINNNPVKMRLFTSNDAKGYRVTPFYNEDVIVPANYLHNTGYLLANTTASTTPPTNPSYMIENSNVKPREGNATLVVIQGVFNPKEVYDADGINLISPTPTDATFWRLYDGDTKEYGAKYYTEEPNSTAKASEGLEYVAEYAGGVCYYGLWLKDAKQANTVAQYTVPRNTFWNVTIYSVTGAGSSLDPSTPPVDPEDPETPPTIIPDPETPLTVNTWMKATITVADWTLVEQKDGI